MQDRFAGRGADSQPAAAGRLIDGKIGSAIPHVFEESGSFDKSDQFILSQRAFFHVLVSIYGGLSFRRSGVQGCHVRGAMVSMYGGVVVGWWSVCRRNREYSRSLRKIYPVFLMVNGRTFSP